MPYTGNNTSKRPNVSNPIVLMAKGSRANPEYIVKNNMFIEIIVTWYHLNINVNVSACIIVYNYGIIKCIKTTGTSVKECLTR